MISPFTSQQNIENIIFTYILFNIIYMLIKRVRLVSHGLIKREQKSKYFILYSFIITSGCTIEKIVVIVKIYFCRLRQKKSRNLRQNGKVINVIRQVCGERSTPSRCFQPKTITPQEESNLKISAYLYKPFLRSQGTIKQKHRLTELTSYCFRGRINIYLTGFSLCYN